MVEFVEINKEQIPYIFEISFKKETFQFEVLYNTTGDYFTINLYKNHHPIAYGQKLVFGVPLFETLRHLDIPKVVLIPYDVTMDKIRANRITYENFGEDVFLYAVDTGN